MNEVNDSLQNVIGRKIKSLCLQEGISYAALAEQADISTASLYKILSGSANPRLSTLQLICRALGVSIEQLLSYNGNLEKGADITDKQLMYLIKTLKNPERYLLKKYIDLLIETRRGI